MKPPKATSSIRTLNRAACLQKPRRRRRGWRKRRLIGSCHDPRNLGRLNSRSHARCHFPFASMRRIFRNLQARASGREGLAYCLLGSGCRDGSVGRDGAGGVGLEGAGWRVGSGSRAVICPSPSAWPLRSSTGRPVCGPRTRFSLSVLRSRRRLYPTRPGLVCARLHMVSKHGRQISFPLRLQPELNQAADGFGAGRGIFSAPFLNLAHQFIRDADPVQRLCAGSGAALFTFNGN
jgi:hypothetical protein